MKDNGKRYVIAQYNKQVGTSPEFPSCYFAAGMCCGVYDFPQKKSLYDTLYKSKKQAIRYALKQMEGAYRYGWRCAVFEYPSMERIELVLE